MKIFITVAVVALLCVQTLHGTPVNSGNVVVTETSNGGKTIRTTTSESSSITSNGAATFPSDFKWPAGFNPADFEGKSGSFSYQSSTTTGGQAGGQAGGVQVGGGQISGGQISGGQISGGQITGGQISGGQISGGGSSATVTWTGGVSTGGVSTGGVSTGGVSTGGVSTGGVSTGGVSTGGVSTGGVSTGGVSTGGVSTGGVSTGGHNGGVSTGGHNGGGSTGGHNGGGSTGGHNGGGSTGGHNGGGSTGGNSDEDSSEENSTGSAKPCGCHGHVNIDDIDLSEIDSQEIYSHSNIIQENRDKDCEKQRAKLNNDNDNLTRQLKNANAAIASLSEEKSWVLGELEDCRDEYDCLSKDYIVFSTEIKLYKKKYQLASDEVTKLKTLLIASNSEGLAWKTKSENLLIEYNKVIQINIQNTQTINEYNTTIINLRKEVNEIKIQINNCGTESGEWKTKYENEKKNSATLTANIKTLEITIADLKSKNEKLTGELSCCRNTNHDNDVEINGYKNTITDLKSQISKITIDVNNCNVKLDQLTIDFSEDQIDDLAVLAHKDQLQLELNECNERTIQLTIDYNAEKTRANKCSDDILQVRGDCQARYSEYDIQINELTINFQGRIDKCEADLVIERNTIININIDITKLRNELIEVKNKWTISIETSHEWQVKSENCEINKVTLQETIVKLRESVDKTNEQLNTCVENSKSLQNELTVCQEKNNDCEADLAASDVEIDEKDKIIDDLKSDVLELQEAGAECDGKLSSLRCSINKFLPLIRDSENQATQALIDIKGIFDNTKAALGQFVDGVDIHCESCGTDGPCISNGAGIAVAEP